MKFSALDGGNEAPDLLRSADQRGRRPNDLLTQTGLFASGPSVARACELPVSDRRSSCAPIPHDQRRGLSRVRRSAAPRARVRCARRTTLVERGPPVDAFHHGPVRGANVRSRKWRAESAVVERAWIIDTM